MGDTRVFRNERSKREGGRWLNPKGLGLRARVDKINSKY
jgi:hypothetical protein